MDAGRFATGGLITPPPGHDMPRVDHYERTMVMTADGKVMCQYTPVFETSE